jgi:hypothetical protein
VELEAGGSCVCQALVCWLLGRVLLEPGLLVLSKVRRLSAVLVDLVSLCGLL